MTNNQLSQRQSWLFGQAFRHLRAPKVINVTFVPSEYPLGTQDGTYWSILPSDTGDDDEEGNHGRN